MRKNRTQHRVTCLCCRRTVNACSNSPDIPKHQLDDGDWCPQVAVGEDRYRGVRIDYIVIDEASDIDFNHWLSGVYL